ncbi:hypothetical protein GGD67_003821 [Bradyrhizobium sp. IAR9]|uniref:hypothetical protein n=1 Tax=Bradyrhizobium sp. IAR9 TaxID=2663841 RepID=UPI0015CA96D8|nr:hypothetical protein [Bradyrhizobium sp. IAR9]NYG46350.1 hypothetical protein [Bradyrhizobium sp. IAR9]
MNSIVVQESPVGTFTQLAIGQSFTVGDVQHGWQVVELWPDEELAQIGIFKLSPAMVPAGEEVVSGNIERVDGVVKQVVITQPAVLKASARQLRLAMNATGLRDDIEEYVASQSRDVQDSWQWTTEFESTHPFVVGAAEQLNKSTEELRALFLLAQTF